MRHGLVILLRISLLALGPIWTAPALANDNSWGCRLGLAYYELGVLYYKDSKGEYRGIDKDVVDELSRRTGCSFETRLESRPRIWEQLAKGQLDMSVSGIPTPERRQFADFLPYFSTRNYLLMHKELAAHISTPEAFLADSKRTVAVVKSFKHGPFYDAWLAQLRAQHRVHEMSDFDSVFRVFKAGRVDAILALPTSAALLARREQMEHSITTLDWAPNEHIVHGLILARSRVQASDIERLYKALSAMRQDGTIERIFRRHVGDSMARQMAYEGEGWIREP